MTIRHPGAAAPAAALALVLAAHACAPAQRPEPVEPPSLADISSATFTGIYGEPVQLTRGRYEGFPPDTSGASHPILELVLDLHAEGDLDGDGSPEAAVLLKEDSGGSGTFIYLAAVGVREGTPVNLGTVMVGDRVQVRFLAIESGTIRLGLVAHASDDPMCCPTRVVVRSWALVEGELVETGARDEGELGLGLLADGRWVLDEIDGRAPGAGTEPVTLGFDGSQVSGSAGCNRYSGMVRAGEPGELSLGPLMTTRKGCPDPVAGLERAYLEALESATGYAFRMGRLVVHWQRGEKSGALLYVPEARPGDGEPGPQARAGD